MQFSGIYVDIDLWHRFIDTYSESHIQIQNLYDKGGINQKQFRSLQQEITENHFPDFFIQEVDCGTDLISIV
tara:strand:+ start:510 stop:725 length:216 start_codon:yes stop_codon:yes gene_type:complete